MMCEIAVSERKAKFGELFCGATFFRFEDGDIRDDFLKVEETEILTGAICGTGEKGNPIHPETRRINAVNGDGQLVYFQDDEKVYLD